MQRKDNVAQTDVSEEGAGSNSREYPQQRNYPQEQNYTAPHWFENFPILTFRCICNQQSAILNARV